MNKIILSLILVCHTSFATAATPNTQENRPTTSVSYTGAFSFPGTVNHGDNSGLFLAIMSGFFPASPILLDRMQPQLRHQSQPVRAFSEAENLQRESILSDYVKNPFLAVAAGWFHHMPILVDISHSLPSHNLGSAKQSVKQGSLVARDLLAMFPAQLLNAERLTLFLHG